MTGDELWVEDWLDKTTPPYTVIAVERPYPNRHPNYFAIYYRSYKKAVKNVVYATDELGAFSEGLKLMAKLRAKSDKLQRKHIRK